MKKIALFADVQNLYYTVRQAHGCHFNYSALWADVSRRGTIVEAYAYAIERGDPRQQQFQQILRKLGFTVKLNPYPAQRRLGQGRLGRGYHHRCAGCSGAGRRGGAGIR